MLLNLKLGDCISCYQNLAELTKNEEIPWVAVFSSTYQMDSADLIDRYNLDVLKIPVLFNDKLYNLTKSDENLSTISFLSVTGNIKWTRNLNTVSYNVFQDSLLSLFNQERGYKIREKEIEKNSSVNRFIFNYATGTVRYWPISCPEKIVWIRPKDLNKEILSQNLPLKDKKLLYRAWEAVEKSPVYSNTIRWLDLDKNGNPYILFNYYSYYSNEDSVLNQKFCIVKHSIKDASNKAYPVMFNEFHNYHVGFFLLKDSSTVYFLTSDNHQNIRDLVKYDSIPIYNLAEYKLKNGRYEFNSLVHWDLPLPYRKDFLYNDFSLNFSCYPYVGYRHSNVIYNIESGKTTDILENDPVYRSLMKAYRSNFFVDNFLLEPIMINKQTGAILITYKLKNAYYALLYSPQMKLIKRTSLNDLLQYFEGKAGPIKFIMVDNASNALMVYCQHDFIKLPMILFS